MGTRLARLLEVQKSKAVDALLITRLSSIRHLSGYFFNFEIGPSPFHQIPAALVAVPGGKAGLVVADTESGQLGGVAREIEIRSYASYTFERPLDFRRQFQERLHGLIRDLGAAGARIGIEPGALPLEVYRGLQDAFPHCEWIDAGDDIAQLRLRKDTEEIELIRQAAHLCDVGQKTVVEEARPGLSELDLFAKVRAAMESAAGRRLPIMADLVSGPRTFQAGGGPSPRILEPSDLIISDLTPCLDGYWGDTCNTAVVGIPTKVQQALFARVKEALELGIQAVRPGVRASEIDTLMRGRLSEVGTYSHHSGHGIGVTNHEEPRIVPYNDQELCADTVVCLEPGVYRDGQGLRLEHMVLVTERGGEPISRFAHRLNDW